MSAKTDLDYLRDMLSYAEDARSLVANRVEDDLDNDPSLRYALHYCLLIIGEAASHISGQTRAKLPVIPWAEIVGMRNFLVHGYSHIKSSIVWQTATRNLAELEDSILQFLPPEQT